MPNVRLVFTLDHVAKVLDEHPELVDAIVNNEDNLTYGSIITICAGPGNYLSALTDDGIDELRDFIADFRRSPEEWDDFLQSRHPRHENHPSRQGVLGKVVIGRLPFFLR